MEPITCAYGSEVKVYESSAASGPHIWLNVQTDVGALTQQKPGEGTAHLTLEQAELLRDQLSHLISHHYQTEDEQEADTFSVYHMELHGAAENPSANYTWTGKAVVVARTEEEARETALNHQARGSERTLKEEGWESDMPVAYDNVQTTWGEPKVLSIQRYYE